MFLERQHRDIYISFVSLSSHGGVHEKPYEVLEIAATLGKTHSLDECQIWTKKVVNCVFKYGSLEG